MSDPSRPASYTFEVSSYPQVFVAAPSRPRQHYWLHILLLLVTLITTLIAGARLQYNFVNNLPAFDADTFTFPFLHLGWMLHQPRLLLMGIPFSLTLMGILLAHELGHYLFCEWNRVNATWPYFIPAPILSPIGTFGAVIRIKSPIRSRKVLFDIGIAGPIAGFLVALPVLLWGLALSKPLPPQASTSALDFGYPLIFHIFHRLLVPFTHNASPMSELYLHPIGVAAWVGILATALNLLPGGQFDGGHIIYAIAPRAHKWVTRGTVGILIPLGLFFWSGWLVWAIILAFAAARHPNVPQWPEIGVARRWMAALAVLMLVLTLVPAPIHGYAIIQW